MKKLIAVLFFLIFGAGLVIQYGLYSVDDDFLKVSEDQFDQKTEVKKKDNVRRSTTDQANEESHHPSYEKAKQKKFTFESWEDDDVVRWQDSRGFSRNERRLYDEMSLEELLILADEANDIYAMAAVASKYHLLGDLKGVMDYYTKASIHGSVDSLFRFGIHLETAAQSLNESQLPKLQYIQQAFQLPKSDSLAVTKRNLLVKSIAYQLVSAKRGEFFYSYDSISGIVRSYRENPLTQEEVRRAILDSRKIMSELSQARRELGLPEFDNSYNPSYLKMYKKLYGLTEENYSEQMLIDLTSS